MLLTYILQDNYCKWVDGWLQNKVYKLPCLFSPPGHPWITLLADFFFFFAPLHMGAFSQANHSHPHMS